MKSIERFLKSRWYLLLVFLLAFIGFISSGQYKVINQFIILLFLITFLLLLVFFDNSVYTIPILLASIYSFNQQNTSLSTIHGLNFIHIIPFFLMVSILS